MSLSGQIITLVVLVLCSAYFSGTEASFLSSNHIRLKNMSGNGNKRASLVLKLQEKMDDVISTLLIGNNLVNILATAIATTMFTNLSPAYGTTIATIVMTVVVLIFGEILPKSLANQQPERFVMNAAPSFRVIEIILKPLSLLFRPVSAFAKRLGRKKGTVENAAEDELMTMVEEAEEGGGLEEDESDLIRSAIEFNDVDVDEVLTRRVNMTAIEDTTPMDEVRDLFFNNGFSRIPVYHETIDNIIGILYEKDFMANYIKGGKEYLSLLNDVLYVPKSMKISDLLKKFQRSKAHMALVLDESGGIEGLVTMEDILEELVGEIYDEHDEVEVTIQKVGENRWKMTGTAELDDVFEALGLSTDPDEFESTTLSGFLMEEMEHIPVSGEHYIYQDVDFLVTKANRKTVLEVTAKRILKETGEEKQKDPEKES